MAHCPHCHHNLEAADLERRVCPACGRGLPDRLEAPSEGTVDLSTPAGGGESGALPDPHERTVESPSGAATDRGEGPAPEEPPAASGEFDASAASFEATMATPPPGQTSMPGARSDEGEWSGATLETEGPTASTAGRDAELSSRALLEEGGWSEANAGRTIKQEGPAGAGPSQVAIKRRILGGGGLRPGPAADYELLTALGEGGMGVVYEARQAALDRTVALKMIKTEAAESDEVREKFVSEAAVTGDLDHPNIVPIYDMGANDKGFLFYAMKRVRGTPWDQVLRDKSLEENLDILLRVADGVAFAHSRGVIHRDLKPENVMLGGFGEVLIMDWGLAVSVAEGGKAGRVTPRNALAGTPAYMAPEMAAGQAEDLGTYSDVYLLGAVLYELVTGRRPHSGKSLRDCLRNAASNVIDPAEGDEELVRIAHRAMALEPKDRYASVQAFQAAVREYLSHAESIALARRAGEDLERASHTRDYEDFAQALFRLREAIGLWEGNRSARQALSRAHLEYAACAFEKHDLDLAWGLLDPLDAEHVDLWEAVRVARWRRDAHARRLRLARVAALTAAVVTLGALGYLVHLSLSKSQDLISQTQTSARHHRRAQGYEAELTRRLGTLSQVREILDETGDQPEALQEVRRTLALARARWGERTWPFSEDEAKRRQLETAHALDLPVRRTVNLPGGARLDLMLVPAGEFEMGSPPSETNSEDEQLHRVRLMPPFYMGRTEVTQGQWTALVDGNPSKEQVEEEDVRRLPVQRVDWEEITETFLPTVNEHAPEGWRFRLPTEAEWEYACRAGSQTPYAFGEDAEDLTAHAWFAENAERRTHPVGLKEPNAWGLHDMYGNVWEWCVDVYDPDFYERSPIENPVNQASARGGEVRRVLRGGARNSVAHQCRSASRQANVPHVRNPQYGFRLVLVREESEESDEGDGQASEAVATASGAEASPTR